MWLGDTGSLRVINYQGHRAGNLSSGGFCHNWNCLQYDTGQQNYPGNNLPYHSLPLRVIKSTSKTMIMTPATTPTMSVQFNSAPSAGVAVEDGDDVAGTVGVTDGASGATVGVIDNAATVPIGVGGT